MSDIRDDHGSQCIQLESAVSDLMPNYHPATDSKPPTCIAYSLNDLS